MRLPLLALLTCLAAPVAATEASDAPGTIAIDLNTLEPQNGACRLIFVAENATETDLSALVLEAVLFDTEGRVAALTLLDFEGIPASRLRVRPFDLPGLDCDALDRLLINDVATCDWATDGPQDCRAALDLRSRAGIELLR